MLSPQAELRRLLMARALRALADGCVAVLLTTASQWLAAPLALCGGLKIAYDLALWRAFRGHETEAGSRVPA